VDSDRKDEADQESPLPLVGILLSIYNGEQYLAEQLESLARQRDVRIHIEARDDGSCDASVALFERTCARLGLSHSVRRGGNVGASESFLDLLFQDLSGFDYVALCDQDDVWKECKLGRAVRALDAHGAGPAIYGAAHSLTDERLRILSDSKTPSHIGFGNALSENVIQGATAVINKAGIALLQSVGRPQRCVIHDWWCYMVFAALGTVIFDSTPTILYRQHQANVIGTTHSFVSKWKRRIANHFNRQPGEFFAQAAEFSDLAGDRLPPGQRAILSRLLDSKRSLGGRLALALDRRIRRQERLGDFVWRLMILAGRY
jgi:glycosyltransferase involved in cell wall biosynthesis